MRVRAAIWNRGPAVYFTEGHLEGLADVGVRLDSGKALALSVDRDVEFMCGLPSNVGPRLHLLTDRQGSGPWRYGIECSSDGESDGFEMGMCDCDAEWQGIRLRIMLPRVEDMPWPSLEIRGQDRKRDFAIAQLAARRRRCAAQNGKLHHVPDRYLELVTRP